MPLPYVNAPELMTRLRHFQNSRMLPGLTRHPPVGVELPTDLCEIGGLAGATPMPPLTTTTACRLGNST